MNGKVTLIGCTKLDGQDYSDKLSEIIRLNNIRSITVTRMEVPCCRGMENAVSIAAAKSGKNIKINTAVISRKGELL